MIKRVTLKNFQSHKDTTVDFSNGISMLTGTSNSGKSAVLRGLRWVIQNKPSGDSVISHWALNDKGKQVEDTVVIVEFDNGDIVQRSKGKDGNLYIVNGQKIEAFGQDVPDLVKETCRFDETNLQTQMDAPFLLADSGGEVAKFFNRIVKLDKIDSYLSLVEQKKRKTKNELDAVKGNLARVEADLTKFDWMPTAKKLLKRIENLSILHKEAEDKFLAMGKTVSAYKLAEADYEKLSFVDKAAELIKEIRGFQAAHKERSAQAEDITDSIQSYESYAAILKQTEILPAADKLCTRLTSLSTKLTQTSAKVEDISVSLERYDQAKAVLDTFDAELKVLKDSLPNVCPTCGQEVKL